MEIFAIPTAPAPQAATASAGAQHVQGASANVDFASVLASMGGSAANSAAVAGSSTQPRLFETPLAAGTGTENTQWQDVGGMLGATAQTTDLGLPNGQLDTDLAMMLQMLQGALESHTMGGTGGTQQVLDIMGQIQKKLLELTETNGQYMAGQQMLALLGQMGANDPFGETDPTLKNSMGDGTALLNSVLSGNPVDALELFVLNSSPEAARAMATAENFAQAQASFANPLAAAQNDLVSVSHQTGPTDESDLNFSGAVRQAQQQMQHSAAASPTGTAAQQGEMAAPAAEKAKESDPGNDIDSLQKQVDAGAFLANTTQPGSAVQAQPAPETPQAPAAPLDMQMEQGVSQALAKGQDRFTLTLRPAELGEVTVQITRGETGTLLNIVAQNPNTQKLLSEDISALQTALRPLNVEIGAVLTQQQADLMAQQQSFQQQRQAWQNQADTKPAPRNTSAGEAEQTAAAAAVMAQAPSSVLDAYI